MTIEMIILVLGGLPVAPIPVSFPAVTHSACRSCHQDPLNSVLGYFSFKGKEAQLCSRFNYEKESLLKGEVMCHQDSLGAIKVGSSVGHKGAFFQLLFFSPQLFFSPLYQM